MIRTKSALLSIILICMSLKLSGQINFLAEFRVAGLKYDFINDQASILQSKSRFSAVPGIRIDIRLSHRYILSTGISTWEIGYKTKNGSGLEFLYPEVNEKKLIENSWTHKMLSIPIQVGWSPKFGGGHDLGSFSFLAGLDMNLTQKSILKDLKDFSLPFNYYETDITNDVRPVLISPTVTIAYQKRRFIFFIKTIFLKGNLYSYEAAAKADQQAAEVNAYYKSYYSFGKAAAPFYQLYPAQFLGIAYKVF